MDAETRACLAPLALLCFVVGGAIPRQAVYSHHHADGNLAHSHAAMLWVHHEDADARSHDHASAHHSHGDGTPVDHDHALHDHDRGETITPGYWLQDHGDRSCAVEGRAGNKQHDGAPHLTSPRARDHVHTQEAFQRAATSSPVVAPAPERAPAAATPATCEPPAASPIAPRSRGPPLSRSC